MLQQRLNEHLILAISSGSVQSVRDAVVSGGQVDARLDGGKSPLHFASSVGTAEKCRLLFELGAVIDTADDDGNTPLHLAKDSHISRVLLECGANPTVKNNRGFIPNLQGYPGATPLAATRLGDRRNPNVW